MLFENRYELISQIGDGGLSQVYLVWDVRLQKEWALKRTTADTPQRMEAFQRETLFLRQAAHPWIPFLVDSFVQEKDCCIVMEYVKGESLKQYLQRKKSMPLRQVLMLMDGIADTLSYLHRLPKPVVYSDLKPSNIMLQKEFGGKLIDFGSVRSREETCQMGTPGYAAPEQLSLESAKTVDIRSDIYSFGVVFYEAITGQKFTGAYLENPFIPQYLRELLFRCTRSNPKRRYQTMEEVRRQLKGESPKAGGWPFGEKWKAPFLLQEMERIILTSDSGKEGDL